MKEKKVKKVNYEVCKPEDYHRRPILTSVNGKCDCATENPFKQRDLEELAWTGMFYYPIT